MATKKTTQAATDNAEATASAENTENTENTTDAASNGTAGNGTTASNGTANRETAKAPSKRQAASTGKMTKKTTDKTTDKTTEQNQETFNQEAFNQERYNNEMLGKVMVELRKPFHPTAVTWKPGALAKGGGKALALAYADLRAYQNRLDEVCGANWAVSYTPWGDRIVCNLTIYGVTRSSTGEPDTQSERSEIAGTATEAQAFKRACAMFGLGRYLYNLPSVWAEYDGERKQFTETAKAKLLSILVQHYRRSQQNGNGDDDFLEIDEQPAESRVPEPLRREFESMGRELYGDQWEQVRRRNVQRVSGGKTTETGELTGEQIQKLIDGLKKLKEQRAVA